MKSIEQLIKTALLGTARASVHQIEWPEPVAKKLKSASDETDPETLLLHGAALLFAYQQGGHQFTKVDIPEDVADEESKPYCSGHSKQILKNILAEQNIALLNLWIQACKQAKQICHPELLPELLDMGNKHILLRADILSVMGERGKWLVSKNPQWQYAIQTQEQIWEVGKAEERKALLTQLREENPQAALILLQSSWKNESAEMRAELLRVLELHPSTKDVPFLEEALHDKSKKVKSVALNLLLLQENSSVAQKISSAAAEILVVKNSKSFFGLKGPSIHFIQGNVNPQLADYDINVESLDKNFSDIEYYLYELLKVISPLYWEKHFQIEGAVIIQAFQKDEKLTKFLPALMDACVLHQNEKWASAFISVLQKGKWALPKDKQYLTQELLQVLAPQDKEECFPASWSDISPLDYLRLCEFIWSVAFSRNALQQLYQQFMQSGINPYEKDKMTALFLYLHPDILQAKNNFLPPDSERKASWREALDALFSALEMRFSIDKSFKN